MLYGSISLHNERDEKALRKAECTLVFVCVCVLNIFLLFLGVLRLVSFIPIVRKYISTCLHTYIHTTTLHYTNYNLCLLLLP